MGAPMLKDGVAVGAILVGWPERRAHAVAPDRADPDLRRSGGDRDRERPPAQRDQGGARASDRHRRDPQGHRRSPDDVQPVFDAIAASSNRLLGGHSTAVWRFRDEAMHLVGFTPTRAKATPPCCSCPARRWPASQSAQRDPAAKPSCVDRHRGRTAVQRGARRRTRARLSQHGDRPAHARRRLDRHAQRDPARARSVHAAPDRAAADLRRPGRDRDRERAPVQRDQGGARAADRDGRGAAGHQQLADRRPAGVRRDRRAAPARSATLASAASRATTASWSTSVAFHGASTEA